VIPGAVLKAQPFVHPDDVAGEVDQPAAGVGPGLWYVHAVDGGDSPRHGQPMDFLYDKFIVDEKLIIPPAVGQVALATGIVV
jgi:hypothetical protein